MGEIEAAGEEGSLGEFAGFGEAGSGAKALADEEIEENRGAVGGDFDDVLGGVGVGGFWKKVTTASSILLGLPCIVKDFGETGLGWSEGMAEFQKGFGDGAGLRAGEADDADAPAAGRGGDGYDGVVLFGHFLMVIRGYFFGGVLGCKAPLNRGFGISTAFLCGFLPVLSALLGT